jgi:mannonate dehydratase
MQQTWRWFGPHDPVTLADARQAGAQGIVTALHHLPPGQVWKTEEIQHRQALIAQAGVTWSVVESVNVSDDIKTRTGNFRAHLNAYGESLRNLAACGIRTVCYNFMPVLDWTRTDLNRTMPDGAVALGFDAIALAAFDVFILRRGAAEYDYPEWRRKQAHAFFATMSESDRERLTATILAGLPGTGTVYSIADIRDRITMYEDISAADLRAHLGEFLRVVCPVAEEHGVRLCIHPDDPPRPLLGLPRVVSTAVDLDFLLEQWPGPANGITFCTGSLAGQKENDLLAMVRKFADRIYFAHLRSIRLEEDGESFVETAHLEGDVDIVNIIRELVREERKRQHNGDSIPIPLRADHGHKLLTDLSRTSVPGYPAVGRLRGLAELRGVLRAVEALTEADSSVGAGVQ